MSDMQRFYKNQRRTEKLQGERKIPTYEAACRHPINRENLRLMYAAYGIARGKSLSQIENNQPKDDHPLNSPHYQKRIGKLIDDYKPKEEE